MTMLIHHYKQERYTYPYVCDFFVPYKPLFIEMKEWIDKTYKPDEIVNNLAYGQVCFREEKYALLFLLRWS